MSLLVAQCPRRLQSAGHVADQEHAPTDVGSLLRQSLKKLDKRWMSPIAIARKAHDLPRRDKRLVSDCTRRLRGPLFKFRAWSELGVLARGGNDMGRRLKQSFNKRLDP